MNVVLCLLVATFPLVLSQPAPITAHADCESDPSSFEKALKAIRLARAGNDEKQQAIIHVSGQCKVRDKVLLDASDSRLDIIGDRGASLSGGMDISGWTKLNKASCKGCGYIWEAPLPNGTAQSRQLYIQVPPLTHNNQS